MTTSTQHLKQLDQMIAALTAARAALSVDGQPASARTSTSTRKPSTTSNGRKPHRHVDKRKVRDWVCEVGEYSIGEMTQALKISEQSARRRSQELVEKGVVTQRRLPRSGRAAGRVIYSYISPKALSGPTHRPRTQLDLPSGPTAPRSGTGKRAKTTSSEINALLDQARAEGWAVEHGGKHIRCRSPQGGQAITVSTTSSDHRAVKNTRAHFRRAGLKV